jgi:hypothetical protein
MEDGLTDKQILAMKRASNRLRQKIWRELHPDTAESRAKAAYLLRLATRNLLIDDYKIQHGCAICGFKGHPVALDFHHPERDGKELSIGKLKMGGLQRLKDEMKRCEVLCANCHRIKHWSHLREVPPTSLSSCSFSSLTLPLLPSSLTVGSEKNAADSEIAAKDADFPTAELWKTS